MNTKTTITLAFFLTVLILGLYIVRMKPQSAPAETAVTAPKSSPTSRELLKEKLGDIVKISVQRKDHDEWVFEKSKAESEAATAEWRLTAPYDMKVVRWEPDRMARQLTGLQYELSFRQNQSGAPSAAQAGLEPPQAVVTLTDAEGKSATIEIGKPESENATYLRLANADDIAVGKANLQTLFKKRLVEYREQNPWTFDVKDVTRLEIEQRLPEGTTNYAFVPLGSAWGMESPIAAKATAKVADAVRELSRLRAVQWVSDDPAKLSVHGLENPPLTLRVTIEKEVKSAEQNKASETPEGDEPDSPPKPPQTERTVHVVHVSDRSPIGEDTKVYFRVGEEPVSGTILKNTADKLRPVMSEWRDMHVTQAEVTAATRIDITTPAGATTLVKKEGAWSVEAGGAYADETTITATLNALRDLNAVAFTDSAAEPAAANAFATPQADIKVMIPGAEMPERITVGDYTDAGTKRLFYVRRNDAPTVGKVRVSDVEPLLQEPLAYLDRTIFDIPTAEIDRVSLSLSKPLAKDRVEFVLGREGTDWKMVEPVVATVRADRVTALIDALAHLRAERVVGQGDEASAFGLHEPRVRLVITRRAPEPAAEENDEAENGQPENQPANGAAARTLEVLTTEHDGKFYAKRADQSTIFEIGGTIYAQLFNEFRTDSIWTFDETKVNSFSIRQGDTVHAFERKDGKWVYRTEPDLPLDQKKVLDLLLRIRDLKTEQFVSHNGTAPPGLEQPKDEVVITLDTGSPLRLVVGLKLQDTTASSGSLAKVDGQPGVFLLTDESLARFSVSLEQLELQ